MDEIRPQYSVPWTVNEVWLGLAAFGLWLVFGMVVIYAAGRYNFSIDVGLVVTLGEAFLLAPVWWLGLRKYRTGWRATGLRGFDGKVLLPGIALMTLSFGFNFVYVRVLMQFNLQMQVDLVPVFEGLPSPWLLFFGGAVVAPVVEEIFFRGFIFAGLRQVWGWQKAALVSAALFGLLHVTPTAMLPIFILGYIFAWLYQKSGSIWPAILMHMLTNSLALGAQMLLAYYG